MILTDEERALLAHEMVKGCKSVNWLASRLEAEVLRKLRERPADAWMRDSWGPDCGPFVELYKASEMGWRDKEGWTPLHIIPEVNE